MGFRPRVQLASAVDRDFERVALPYFQLVFPSIVRPTARAKWDQKGVDLMTSPERDPIEVCVQCKTTTKPQFELSDIPAFKEELDKFLNSGVRCDRYILALNRSDFDGRIQKAIDEHLASVPNPPRTELWQLARIVDEAQGAVVRQIQVKVAEFNSRWREQLVGRFSPSGSWVRRVPATIYRMMIDSENEPEIRSQNRTQEVDIRAVLLNDKGPHMVLLIGDDGTGKTSASLIASQSTDKTVIYVPAASLTAVQPSDGTSILTREIGRAINVYPPDDENAKLFIFFMGRGLSGILREDPNVVLIIDGLDENRVFRGFEGLKLIRSQLKGMRCKTIISTRTKHFNLRTGDFAQALQDKGRIGERRKGVQVVELAPWTKDTIIKHIEDAIRTVPSSDRTSLTRLLSMIKDGTADQLYGTLLSHPIFLDLIIDDVVNDKIRKSTRSSLVRNWIFRKIKRDQNKYQGEPLAGDVTQEARLIFRALEDIGLRMAEARSRIPVEALSHSAIIELLAQYKLTADEIFVLLLKSVLVAVGQTTTFLDAKIMFSHRIFHEYLIASALVRTKEEPTSETPLEIVRFYHELNENDGNKPEHRA